MQMDVSVSLTARPFRCSGVTVQIEMWEHVSSPHHSDTEVKRSNHPQPQHSNRSAFVLSGYFSILIYLCICLATVYAPGGSEVKVAVMSDSLQLYGLIQSTEFSRPEYWSG